MAISVFDLFSIGIGPSSSHTVGPMRAARMFARRLKNEGALAHTAAVRAELFGSLGATGHGHGTPKAVLLGLEGESPRTVDVETADERVARIREQGRLRLLATEIGDAHEIAFDERTQLILHRRRSLPYHANGMTLFAYDEAGTPLLEKTYYSVGGGFVVDEDAVGEAIMSPSSSSSSRRCMGLFAKPPELGDVPKGLLPGKLCSARPPCWLECCCESRNSARCDSRRRLKKLAQNCRMSWGLCLRISRSRAAISLE